MGSKGNTCEMKPVDIYCRDMGNVGVIVSVFSAENKLLAQVTNTPLLKDRGKTSFQVSQFWMRDNP